jgi:hypothetical protein
MGLPEHRERTDELVVVRRLARVGGDLQLEAPNGGAEVGETVKVEFAVAPAPFDLRLERSDDSTVVWRTETFPTHWVGTTVRWDVEPRDDGAAVRFRHSGLGDEDEAGMVAYTWGQVMVRLKEYAESGRPNPVFT